MIKMFKTSIWLVQHSAVYIQQMDKNFKHSLGFVVDMKI